MKERITYALPSGDEQLNPDDIKVTKDSLSLPDINAVKEWRLSIDLTELDKKLSEALRNLHDLHLRWDNYKGHERIAPFYSRTTPGFHAFVSPRIKGQIRKSCELFAEAFKINIDCTENKTFTETDVTNGRLHYYTNHIEPRLVDIIELVKGSFCTTKSQFCSERLEDIDTISALTLDYSSNANEVLITATWPLQSRKDVVRKVSVDHRVEVGILAREENSDTEKIGLGGWLTVLGQDDRPKPTRFEFFSRHHDYSTSHNDRNSGYFALRARHPSGLHPTLQIDIKDMRPDAPSDECNLYAYFTLPPTVFIDRHQFSDELFLKSQNLVSLVNISGDTDLEAPLWTRKQWGSSALFQIVSPPNTMDDSTTTVNLSHEWTISIPLHLRYLPPGYGRSDNITESIGQTYIPYPAVFRACSSLNGAKLSINPFDRQHLGYDTLFSRDTIFWHLRPEPPSSRLTLNDSMKSYMVPIDVPILDISRVDYVETGTCIAVLFGFLWICYKLFKSLANSRSVQNSVVIKDKKFK